MRIEHIAIWTNQMEEMREFYEKWFGAASGQKYINSVKCFESYFLNVGDGARLELMTIPGLADECESPRVGYAHISVSVGSREEVVIKTGHIRAAGYAVVSEPRVTGDGYFESVVLDPDGNWIEITE